MGSCVWSKLEKIHQDHESHDSNGTVRNKLHKPNRMPNLIKAKQYSPDDSDANGEDETVNENDEDSGVVQFFFSDDLIRESAANKKIYGYVDQILPTVRSVILKK